MLFRPAIPLAFAGLLASSIAQASDAPLRWTGVGYAPCSMAVPCTLAEGSYMVRVPPHWDGKSPLPSAVWFHGYQQSASEIMSEDEIADPFANEGILLIVPDGRDKRWSFPNGPVPTHPRDEAAFIAAMLADVGARFPLDPKRTLAAGFSLGATMVWTQACQTPERFAAYLAFSGDFWEPLPTTCAPGRVALLHIHGTADKTFPIAGRPLAGGRWHQGDAMKGLTLWRQWKSCPQSQPAASSNADFTCTDTGACPGGSRVTYCQHAREHEVDIGWVGSALEWVKARWAEQGG